MLQNVRRGKRRIRNVLYLRHRKVKMTKICNASFGLLPLQIHSVRVYVFLKVLIHNRSHRPEVLHVRGSSMQSLQEKLRFFHTLQTPCCTCTGTGLVYLALVQKMFRKCLLCIYIIEHITLVGSQYRRIKIVRI